MSNETVIGIIVVFAVIAIAAGIWLYLEKRRSKELQERFGPEYDRVVGEGGSRRQAEKVLAMREKRVASFPIRPLSPEDRERFASAWRTDQARFVDDPPAAVQEADRLVAEAMTARGYPVADFDQRADDISVDHPDVVENYRAAHAIALRHQRGEASTEDLRQAMVYYRALFDELLAESTLLKRKAV